MFVGLTGDPIPSSYANHRQTPINALTLWLARTEHYGAVTESGVTQGYILGPVFFFWSRGLLCFVNVTLKYPCPSYFLVTFRHFLNSKAVYISNYIRSPHIFSTLGSSNTEKSEVHRRTQLSGWCGEPHNILATEMCPEVLICIQHTWFKTYAVREPLNHGPRGDPPSAATSSGLSLHYGAVAFTRRVIKRMYILSLETRDFLAAALIN
ncbi:hypothetical protein J6590_004637 [Homalodisca vitripennis]|nr:hypothetical protein J6590_004637 [Homalodisca vitripennis]